MTGSKGRLIVGLVWLPLLAGAWCLANAQSAPADTPENANALRAEDTLLELDRLIEHNARLEKQNRELMEQIQVLRRSLAQQVQNDTVTQPANSTTSPAPASAEIYQASDKRDPVTNSAVEQDEIGQGNAKKWGAYTPNLGFKLAETEHGDLSVSIYTYARYLNQRGLDDTYTDSFGNLKAVQQRQDFQLQKLQVKFLGWVFDPRMRYFLYGWTSNANQGQGAQVVLAGNINFDFNKHLSLGAGIFSLPNTRSVEGNFPFWLNVDSRLIADEFFRGSYTTGLQLRGQITETLRYQVMVANNLSTLGVSAAQLDNKFNTLGSALVWMPTTGEYGNGFGDFENHQEIATRLAVHFSRSDEDRESQPGTDVFENTQLKLSDGNIIFTPNLFGPGITITDARYRMTAVDGGAKYRGYEVSTQYFWRWLDNFQGPGTAAVPNLFDHGFELQASVFVLPKNLQLYAGGSKIFGQFGDPYDARFGVNWFPWKNRVVRWNNEVLYLYQSPVGYTSVPFANGGTGFVFHSSWELAF